jgi:hypothetical protein
MGTGKLEWEGEWRERKENEDCRKEEVGNI